MPRPDAACLEFVNLERFYKSLQHEPRQAIYMEKPLEGAWVGQLFEWGRISGTHQGRAMSVSQVDRDSDMVATCVCMPGGKELNKETDSASTSVWEEAAPLALALKPDNSIPPCTSLVPFKLLLSSGAQSK